MSAKLIRQLGRYAAAGAASVAVYICVLWLLVNLTSLPEGVANVVAYSLATLVNYFGHFYWSFVSARTHGEASWRFLAVVFVGLALNSIFVPALSSLDVRIELAALLFAVLWPVASFTSLKFWALR